MNNNAELIAAGHELAKCLDNEPLIDIAKLLSKMATQLDVTTAALREKTKQCEQLANELNAVEAIHNDAVFITDEHYDQCPPEVQKIISKLAVMVLPATDAFLREVRASELDSLCGVAETMLVKFANQNASQITEAQGWEMIRQQASKRAAKLRQGGAA